MGADPERERGNPITISMAIRVCHMIAGDQWAGAEIQTAHLLSGLAQYEQIELSAILFAEGMLSEELTRSGVLVTVLDEQKLGVLGLVRETARLLRDRQVQILHTHRYKENILGGLAGQWAGIPWFVRTEHGRTEPFQGIDRIKMSLYKGVDYLVARFVTDWVIAVSYDLYTYWCLRLSQGRVALILNGIDPRRITSTASPEALRQQLGLPLTTPVFGTVGRLVPVKGLDCFLKAAKGILEKLPESRFLIVGEGPLRSLLERQAQELGIQSAVCFVGFRRDALEVLNLMDVFVLPSLSEGLPMVLLEAMLLGKPIVASAVGGIPEVLHDPYGWLVPPGDARSLKEACIEAFAAAQQGINPSVREKRIDGIEHLASTMCYQTCALYQDLVRRNSGRL